MPEGGTVVGWIPQAFVSPLSEDMARKLRNVREEVRMAEFEAERLYNSAPFEINLPLFDTDSANTSPSLEGYEVYMVRYSLISLLLVIAIAHASRQKRTIITHAQSALDEYATTAQAASGNLSPPQISRRPSCTRAPPSPTSPMPYPPSSSRDKPTPPTPPPSDDANKKKRSIRRRPLIVDDNPTLRRFNSFLESKDMEAIERLSTPNLSGTFGSISRRTREDKQQKRKETNRNKDLPSSPGSKPRYLRLMHEKDIDADDKGNIRSATIHALIERLTTHAAMIDSRSEFSRI